MEVVQDPAQSGGGRDQTMKFVDVLIGDPSAINVINGRLGDDIMVGGPKEAYQRALPAFDVMGAVVRHVGPTGSGTAAKLVNQLLVGIHMVAAAEAMLLGAKSGADPALVFELVNSGWGQSFLLGRNAPAMLDRDFEGIRTQLRVFLKDLGLIQEMARDLETPIAAGDLAYRLLEEAVEQGLGDLDSAAIVLPMEQQAGFEISRVAGAGD